MAERDCPACKHIWEMWDRIIEDSGDALYGRIATYIMGLECDLDVNPDLGKTLPAWEHEMMKVVRLERIKFENSQNMQQSQSSSSSSGTYVEEDGRD